MGAGHAVFFVEEVGGFAVKFELHLRVVVEHFHAVPLLRVDRPDVAFRGEDVFGSGRTVFREFAEFEPARQYAQLAPGACLGVVLIGDGGGDGVFVPDGHGFVGNECGHGVSGGLIKGGSQGEGTVYITKLPEYRPLRHVLKQGFLNCLQQCRSLLINPRPFAFARPGDVQRFNVVRA